MKKVQLQRREINDIQFLKDVLTNAWNDISLDIIQKATQSWLDRLRRCSAVDGKHFEHYLEHFEHSLSLLSKQNLGVLCGTPCSFHNLIV